MINPKIPLIVSIWLSAISFASVRIEKIADGIDKFQKGAVVLDSAITLRIDDYVSNPQPGKEVPSDGFLTLSQKPVYGDMGRIFYGFVKPSPSFTAVKPLPKPVGVVFETKLWPCEFSDFSKEQVTSDIRGRNAILFRFVDVGDSSKAATVSAVGFRLGGKAFTDRKIRIKCFDLSGNLIYEDLADDDNFLLKAFSNNKTQSVIHRVLFYTDSNDIWVIGSNAKNPDHIDILIDGFEVTDKDVVREYDAIPDPFDLFEGRWVDPRCKKIVPEQKSEYGASDKVKSLVVLKDGSLITFRNGGLMESHDKGHTWKLKYPKQKFSSPGRPHGGLLTQTHTGVLVLVYMDSGNYVWNWPYTDLNATDVQFDVWAMRSLDGGRTWIDRQMIFDGYCGALRDIKQISTGHVVVPISLYLSNPGHHGTRVYVSPDDGKTWKGSNVIDLGGKGNHDGAVEGTLTELSDGRLLMFLRTSWDRFWEVYSSDHGHSWRVWRPSELDASSAPGYLLKLSSGRLIFAWNRLYPEGLSETEKQNYPRTDPSEGATGMPASWHRSELSIVFSEDNGESWTEPIIIARQPNAYLAYPYMIEYKPGEIWLFTQNNKLLRGPNKFPMPGIGIKLKEADFAFDKN